MYDALGRVTSDTQTITGLTPSVVLASAYDANSNRTQLKATIGGTADYKNDYLFDNLSRETRVTQQGQSGGNAVASKRVDFTYNAVSQMTVLARYPSTGLLKDGQALILYYATLTKGEPKWSTHCGALTYSLPAK